jgi:CHAT domain-containing protein
LPTPQQIQFVAQEIPLAYLTVTKAGALALVISGQHLEVVWSELDDKLINEWLIQKDGEKVVGGYLPGEFGNTLWLNASLKIILPTLGAKLIGQLAMQLRTLGAKEITLIPTGLLSLFPIHAATYQYNGKSQCLLDEFTVHYTPSVQAQLAAQIQLPTKTSHQLTGVGNPLPNPNPLKFGQIELEEIALQFGKESKVLCGEAASKTELLRSMPEAGYLHFSCHGNFNPTEPLQSMLSLAGDDVLTLDEILLQMPFTHARLAVLSACQTALTDFKRLPDEAIGFPAGFMQAGVPGIVGTLWSVNDLSTALLMVKFYTLHLKDGLAPAHALCNAQLWLRDITNAELSELFDFYRQQSADRPHMRMIYTMAQTKFREYTLAEPNERPFASPYYWAPFVLYGL